MIRNDTGDGRVCIEGREKISGYSLFDQKHLGSFEMWCWRRMEKISWTDQVRNKEVLLRVNEQRNILHEIIKRKANWIGHILHRNWLLKQVIEGKIKGQIEVTRRQGRRRKKLLDDLNIFAPELFFSILAHPVYKM